MAEDINQLLKVRREKLQNLQEAGKDPFKITKCDVTHHSMEIKNNYDELEGKTVTIAGRMMFKRVMGKASFCNTRDLEGDIQAYVARDNIGEDSYKDFKKYDVGDLLCITGEVFKTKTGEISIHASNVTLLSKSLQILPEKFHGLTDTDMRYRQRYVDLIMNAEVKDTFIKRSRIISTIRKYLDGEGFMEVETPMLVANAGGAAARPFETHFNALDEDFKLRISLELYLKRLIVGGMEKVYEIGRVFRNEITPGNFTFRTREFEQMELEFFCKPDTDLEWFDYWKKFCLNWLSALGLKDDEVRYRDHDKEELSFYSKATTDVEFLFPFGWGELWGIADRTDYDLTQHQNVSGQDLTYFDDETKEKYIPYVIEPSLGADRMVLAFLCSAYDEEEIGTEEKPDTRTVLHFHPALAPVKIGVLPLSKKLNEGAEKVFAQLSKKYNCEYDDRGNIGKRYRRQDEIGTPFCVTYDFDSEEDGAVTVRDRDTMEQERIKIEDLDAYFEKKFGW